MESIHVTCPYCLEEIMITWEIPNAAWVCEHCDHTFWVRHGEHVVPRMTPGETILRNGWYTAKMKVSGCCGN